MDIIFFISSQIHDLFILQAAAQDKARQGKAKKRRYRYII